RVETLVDLGAQAADVDVDDIRLSLGGTVVQGLADGGAAEDASLALGEQPQQIELAAGAISEPPAGAGPGGGAVEVPSVGAENGVAAAQGAETGLQFLRADRLHEVAIGPRVQARDLVHAVAIVGQEHENVSLDAGAAPAPQP